VQIKYATVVSRTDESAPKQTKTIHLSQDSNPISGQSDPNISSLAMVISFVTSTKTVGST